MVKVHELKTLSKAIAGGQVDAVIAAFRKFDPSGEGSLATAKLTEVFTSLGAPSRVARELEAIAAKSDFCKDNTLHYEDFAKWLCSSAAEAARLRGVLSGVYWPSGCTASLCPSIVEPEDVKVAGPIPCTAEDNVQFWRAGGLEKTRVRITEDENDHLKLGDEYTVGLRFRMPALAGSSYDTVLLGHDSKHWVAVDCATRRLCFVDGKSKNTAILDATIPVDRWVLLYLQLGLPATTTTTTTTKKKKRGGGPSQDPKTKKNTLQVFLADDDGLFEAGAFDDTSLAGSRLDKMGWAENQVDISEVRIWNRTLSWREMADSLPCDDAPPPAKLPSPPKARAAFRGKVQDPSGRTVPDVKVKWGKKAFKIVETDEDGCFEGSLSDAETELPEDDAAADDGTSSRGSTSSSCTVLSFSADGYAPASTRTELTVGSEAVVIVTMQPLSASATFAVADGGSLVDESTGSNLTVPPNSLTYPDGSPVEGPVSVSFSVIDVTDPAALAAMPGDFSAVGENGEEVFLQSLGAAFIGATDAEGRPLAIDPNSGGLPLELKSKAVADMNKLGSNAELWNFNEGTGKWELQTASQLKVNGEVAPNAAAAATSTTNNARGSNGAGRKMKMKKKGYREDFAEKVAGNEWLESGCMSPEAFKDAVAKGGEKSLATNVQKMGYINCDLAYHHPQRAVMLQGLVQNSDGEPLAAHQVWSVGVDYSGRCPDVTGEDGKFRALISQFDSEVKVEVQHRKRMTDDSMVSVTFENANDWSRLASKKVRKVMLAVAGTYKKGPEEFSWVKTNKKEVVARISWSRERRQWHHLSNGETVFFCDGDDPAQGPFTNGSDPGGSWYPSKVLASEMHGCPAPIYDRGFVMETHTFGPFKTGPPGEFFEVGELKLACK